MDEDLIEATTELVNVLELLWYRKGGEVSEQQWRDVTSMLQVQDGQLEEGYLLDWAAQLGLTELLERARKA